MIEPHGGPRACATVAVFGAVFLVVGIALGFVPVSAPMGRCGSVFDVDLYSNCNSQLDARNALVWNVLALGAFLTGTGTSGMTRRRAPDWRTVTLLGAISLTAAAWAPQIWRSTVLLSAGV